MAEENYLPLLASEGSNEFSTSKLKRPRLGSPTFSAFSSDPIFSSEDEEPSSENYTQERRKKKLRGPWFCHRSRPGYDLSNGCEKSPGTRRTFNRNFDSGIFMGSEFSDDDDDICLDSSMLSNSTRLSNNSVISSILPPADELVYEKVQACLEKGNEIIDLSSQGLTSLPGEAIKQLSSLTRVPKDTEGIFSVLEPALKLFLASNCLNTLPNELFNLNHLEVLSLRSNFIHELSPKISNLLNLKELNLSQNRICYLPYEILTLFSEKGSLEKLSLHPNFFYEPKFYTEENNRHSLDSESGTQLNVCHDRSSTFDTLGDGQDKHSNDRWKLSFKAKTEIRFIDINGKLIKGPHFPTPDCLEFPDPLPVARENYRPIPPSPRGKSLSRAHSLLETALGTCAKSTQASYLSSQLPEDAPLYLRELLDLAVINKENGGTFCTTCQRKYIISRTEWIEWWEISRVRPLTSNITQNFTQNNRDELERLIPLIRRGCSWLCTH
ncbi:hypothetical protein HI914_00273 [Erysiphe necator]|nr:hypothetical protein HI914_00273 [Erysiphe necator]